MKKYILILIFIFGVSNLFAQQNRGFKPVKVKVAGNQTTLYKQSHALVIGNSEYEHWNRLDGVKDDVKKVKTALEENGFNVILKENLTKMQMIEEIDNFLSKYGFEEENRVLIYYAEHGHTLDNNNSKMGYVVPIDAPMPNKDKRGFINKSLPMTQFKTWSESATFCKHSLFIFDACFAGSIFSSRGNPTTNEVINYNTTEFVRQFIASGSENETVPDQSVFCTQFVYALQSDAADMNKDGYMTGTELGEYLKNTVIQYRKNRQHPQYGKLDNPNFDKGDFVFIVGKTNNNNNKIPDIEEEDIAPLGTYGNLEITNYLQGILYIDGIERQTANKNKRIKIKDLTAGKHTIKIKTDNDSWEQQIIIYENKTATLIAKSSYVPSETNDNNDLPNQFIDNRDDKIYKIVEIGNQVWMAENLAYKANSGCWAYDDNSSNVTKYGYLYNWETANKVCPDGYHLPTDDEWKELEIELGMTQTEADKYGYRGTIGYQLKSETGWYNNGNGTNESGFNAFSGGFSNGYSCSVNSSGYWWSSTLSSSSDVWYRRLFYTDAEVLRSNTNRDYGLSVRCLMD